MKLTGISVNRVEDGYVVQISGFVAANEELDEGDIALLFSAVKEVASKEATPVPPTEGRRLRGSATSTSAVAEPSVSTTAAASADTPVTTSRRPRGGSATATTVPPENSRRNRSQTTTAASHDATVSDADLMKAASNAAAIITTAAVKQIISSYGVAAVNELKGADRNAFIVKLSEAIDNA